MGISKRISGALSAAFLLVANSITPASAQNQKLLIATVPSQLGENLDFSTPKAMEACLAKYDAKFNQITLSYDLQNQEGAVAKIHAEENGMKCSRFMSMTSSHQWENLGCEVEREFLVSLGNNENISMGLRMRVDLTTGNLFRTAEDDSDPARLLAWFDNNKYWNDFLQQQNLHGDFSRSVNIELPRPNDIARLGDRLDELSELCRPRV